MLYAGQWCNDPDDALQQALIELVSLDQSPRDPVAWLFTCIRKRSINLTRSESRRFKHQQLAAQQRSEATCDRCFFSDTSCVDAIELQRAIEKLDSLQREIVVAKIWGGLTLEQIALLTGQSKSTVHRHYNNAISELRKRLETSS